MKLLDLTLPSPAENLACDEALLDWCEAGGGEEVLRFWEPPGYFIVVGYANKVAAEVNVPACDARGVPVYRRCSGGGTVLQGPGCLNYSLILKITRGQPLQGITAANRFIMERNRAAMTSPLRQSELQTSDSRISVRGHTDLCLGDFKFSGNSQRRRKHFLLFHGTFLLNLDLTLVTALLPMPSKQPDYRRSRGHAEFLTNLNLPADEVKTALCNVWKADSPLNSPPLADVAVLVRDKYATRTWNFKF